MDLVDISAQCTTKKEKKKRGLGGWQVLICESCLAVMFFLFLWQIMSGHNLEHFLQILHFNVLYIVL